MCLLLGGCASGSGSAGDDRSPLPKEATDRTFQVNTDRLAKLMPYVFEAIHWGHSALEHDADQLTVKALTPDGRRVNIRADKVDDQRVRVTVFVRHFGDVQLQQRLLDTLAQQIERFAGKEIR